MSETQREPAHTVQDRVLALRAELARVFGPEWTKLSPVDQRLIVRDCSEGEGVADLAEYRRNIGVGNLQAYAKVMRVRFAREDR